MTDQETETAETASGFEDTPSDEVAEEEIADETGLETDVFVETSEEDPTVVPENSPGGAKIEETGSSLAECTTIVQDPDTLDLHVYSSDREWLNTISNTQNRWNIYLNFSTGWIGNGLINYALTFDSDENGFTGFTIPHTDLLQFNVGSGDCTVSFVSNNGLFESFELSIPDLQACKTAPQDVTVRMSDNNDLIIETADEEWKDMLVNWEGTKITSNHIAFRADSGNYYVWEGAARFKLQDGQVLVPDYQLITADIKDGTYDLSFYVYGYTILDLDADLMISGLIKELPESISVYGADGDLIIECSDGDYLDALARFNERYFENHEQVSYIPGGRVNIYIDDYAGSAEFRNDRYNYENGTTEENLDLVREDGHIRIRNSRLKANGNLYDTDHAEVRLAAYGYPETAVGSVVLSGIKRVDLPDDVTITKNAEGNWEIDSSDKDWLQALCIEDTYEDDFYAEGGRIDLIRYNETYDRYERVESVKASPLPFYVYEDEKIVLHADMMIYSGAPSGSYRLRFAPKDYKEMDSETEIEINGSGITPDNIYVGLDDNGDILIYSDGQENEDYLRNIANVADIGVDSYPLYGQVDIVSDKTGYHHLYSNYRDSNRPVVYEEDTNRIRLQKEYLPENVSGDCVVWIYSLTYGTYRYGYDSFKRIGIFLPFINEKNVTELIVGEKRNFTCDTQLAKTWTVDDEEVAEVDENGLLHAKKAGTVHLSLNVEGCDFTDTLTITVTDYAYAILTDDGDLIFFRSNQSYENGSTETVTINDAQYTGTVYSQIEQISSGSEGSVPWHHDRSSIKTVRVAEGHSIHPLSTAYWFYECSNLVSFDAKGFDTSNVTNMSHMFAAGIWDEDSQSFVSSLTSLDLRSFDTSNVTNMRNMFICCSALTDLDVSGLNTSKVTDMSGMFQDCYNLTTLDLSGFDTSNITGMNCLFYNCRSLQSVDLTHFDTSKVIRMEAMFFGCSSLESLDLSSFDTSKVYYEPRTETSDGNAGMRDFFNGCDSLISVVLGAGWTNWINEAYLPEGTWANEQQGLSLSETALYDDYPSHAAQWAGTWEKRLDYNITYVLNGGTNNEGNITVHRYKDDPFTLLDPTREWYDFNGWYLNDERITVIPSDLDEDITLYAKWTPINYAITYDLSGGALEEGRTNPDSYNIESDDIILNAPSRHGYTFIGWTGTDLDEPALNVTIPAGSYGNREYTAIFEPNVYEITYVLNGGINDEANISSHTYDEQAFALLPATRDYYTFDGWYLNDERISEIPSDLDEDITLEARWTPINYSITYVLDGGNNDDANPVEYNYESDDIVLADPSRTGYIFDGWFTDEGLIQHIDTISHNSHGDINLYAKWTPITYTLKLDFFGDGSNVEQMDMTYDVPKELIANHYERYRLIFCGWAYSADGQIEYVDGEEVMNLAETNGDEVTLYGVWDHKYQTGDLQADPASGVLEKGNSVALYCATPGAIIRYTVDGSDPKDTDNTNVRIYEDAIEISEDTVIKAYASADGYRDSETVTLTYTLSPDVYGDILDDDIQAYEEAERPEGLWLCGLEDLVFDPFAKAQVHPLEDFRVYFGTTLLEYGKDYTLKYSNNTKAGAASLTITGKGNYVGTLTRSFNIVPAEIDPEIAMPREYAYNAKGASLSPKLVHEGKTLKNKTDYEFKIQSSDGTVVSKLTGPGEYTLTFDGVGNYRFHKETTVRMVEVYQKPVSKLTVVLSVTKTPFTGSEIKPSLTIKDGKTVIFTYDPSLEPASSNDLFSVSYEDNTDVGKAKVIIMAKEDLPVYIGSTEKTFTITGTPINKAKLNENFIASFEYDGKKHSQPDGILSYNGQQLFENRDYTVSYSANVAAGTAAVTFKGMGGYSGTLKKTFKIAKAGLKEEMFLTEESYPYEKGGSKPLPETDLVLNRDYTLSYKANTKVGNLATITIKGKGNYQGTITRTFTVDPASLNDDMATAPDKVYSTKANVWKSTPVLTDINGKKLKAGTDYEKVYVYTYRYDTMVEDPLGNEVFRAQAEEVQSSDIIPAGTVIDVSVTGKGNYEGNASSSYRIVKADLSKAKVTIPNQYYTGKPITLFKSDLTVKLGKDTLKFKDYEVVPGSYVNNIAKGTAKVTIRGINNYGGTKTVTFKIVQKSLGMTIKFNSNGATSGSMKDQMIYKDTKLSKNTFKRIETLPDGSKKTYEFLGFNTKHDGSGDCYQPGELFTYDTELAGTFVILWAQWD